MRCRRKILELAETGEIFNDTNSVVVQVKGLQRGETVEAINAGDVVLTKREILGGRRKGRKHGVGKIERKELKNRNEKKRERMNAGRKRMERKEGKNNDRKKGQSLEEPKQPREHEAEREKQGKPLDVSAKKVQERIVGGSASDQRPKIRQKRMAKRHEQRAEAARERKMYGGRCVDFKSW